MQKNEKIVLVTGGAKRVGKVIVESLHAEGWNIIVHYNSAEQEARQLVNFLNEIRSNSAAALGADLTDFVALKSFSEKALKIFGRLDALINNASTFYPTPILNATEEQWNDLFATNTKAPFFLTKYLLPALLEAQGNVINIIDVHSERPLLDYSIYCMAKAALSMLTKSLALELAPNVRVNGVAPGLVLWAEKNPKTPAEREKILSKIPLKKSGAPLDIARTISFLLNHPFITGEIIKVDGGRSIV